MTRAGAKEYLLNLKFWYLLNSDVTVFGTVAHTSTEENMEEAERKAKGLGKNKDAGSVVGVRWFFYESRGCQTHLRHWQNLKLSFHALFKICR